MSIDVTPLLTPISDSAPAGEEARATESYEVIAAEIEKMTSLSGASPVDWTLVEQQGTNLLSSQTKDFMLAAWLSAAWMERHGLQGLQAGLELQAGLIETFWETAFPPLKRLRGRRNALSWWTERASNWLENNPPAAIDSATHAKMVDAVSRMDSALAERDPDAPPLLSFIQQIKRLDVIPEPGANNDDNGTATADAGSTGNATAGETGNTSAAPASPGAYQPHAAAPAALPGLPDQLSTLDDIVRALSPISDALGHISSALINIDRFQPLIIEVNRFAARAALLSAPPATGSATSLNPPPSAILDAFQTICGAGNADGMIEFCESRILSFPFWLDLDYESARGYEMMGEKGARMRRAIVKDVLAFTERLPELEHLTFSDGMPFASDDTRQWLSDCRASGSGAAANDPFEKTQKEARDATNNGQHEQAMQFYQDLLQSTFSGRDQFRTRIALLDLFMSANASADPMPLAQPIFHDCKTMNLPQWEPTLAGNALQTVLKACKQALSSPNVIDDPTRRENYQGLQQETLQLLARIDFPAASRFAR
ncbi:MAG TPA: type VI secretion system protein TssA [Pusillimonas sp.]|jgi:type VI secretion system protein VasJ|nr:type VI secretion system protein TssA [Pusillimonas sp.]MBC41768.1 type VI secretion system protein TssA [Pusillimonas sp.]HBT34215.1 type VI secretion system protein TssA [Pusillimonas sp.]HCP76572.1 type VI secretion system protein TssA [Pusillimonas sp.]|tara:strand:- start:210864 stop:212492 length:1629 start_codon:yes stop_codon:yes gene_type:complete